MDDVDLYSYFSQLATEAQATPRPPAAQSMQEANSCDEADVPRPTAQPCNSALSVNAPEWAPAIVPVNSCTEDADAGFSTFELAIAILTSEYPTYNLQCLEVSSARPGEWYTAQ
jgi:hypothetical protein